LIRSGRCSRPVPRLQFRPHRLLRSATLKRRRRT
jgi:hypothetical protein